MAKLLTSNVISFDGYDLIIKNKLTIEGGDPGAGKVLQSDASGQATWETSNGGGGLILLFTDPSNPTVGDSWLLYAPQYIGPSSNMVGLLCGEGGIDLAGFLSTTGVEVSIPPSGDPGQDVFIIQTSGIVVGDKANFDSSGSIRPELGPGTFAIYWKVSNNPGTTVTVTAATAEGLEVEIDNDATDSDVMMTVNAWAASNLTGGNPIISLGPAASGRTWTEISFNMDRWSKLVGGEEKLQIILTTPVVGGDVYKFNRISNVSSFGDSGFGFGVVAVGPGRPVSGIQVIEHVSFGDGSQTNGLLLGQIGLLFLVADGENINTVVSEINLWAAANLQSQTNIALYLGSEGGTELASIAWPASSHSTILSFDGTREGIELRIAGTDGIIHRGNNVPNSTSAF